MKVQVKAWGDWWDVKHSLNPKVKRIFKPGDDFCCGGIREKAIQDVRVV